MQWYLDAVICDNVYVFNALTQITELLQ